MKASWLAMREDCNRWTTPISGTRMVRTLGFLSHQSSFAQPKGKSEPLRGAIASLRSGSVIMKATGSPSSSAIMMRSLNTMGFNCLPKCVTSSSVIGTNPQLLPQASFRMLRMIAASLSNLDLSTLRMRMRSFFSPDWTMRWISGGNCCVMSSS